MAFDIHEYELAIGIHVFPPPHLEPPSHLPPLPIPPVVTEHTCLNLFEGGELSLTVVLNVLQGQKDEAILLLKKNLVE